jgi:hypothetical protein
VLDLGLWQRGIFGVVFFGLQLGLIATAGSRPDRVFGFQMFNESSSLKFELFRKLVQDGREHWVPAPEGSWQARTTTGETATFRWTDRVRYRALMQPGVFVHTSYGLDAQLFRLERALKDVITHIPKDVETQALSARVEWIKNGHTSGHSRLVESRP